MIQMFKCFVVFVTVRGSRERGDKTKQSLFQKIDNKMIQKSLKEREKKIEKERERERDDFVESNTRLDVRKGRRGEGWTMVREGFRPAHTEHAYQADQTVVHARSSPALPGA